MKKKKQICSTCKKLINSSVAPGRSKCSLGHKMSWVEKDQIYVPEHQCLDLLDEIKSEDNKSGDD